MAQKQFKIGLSNADKQNMAQDVYERVLALTFNEYDTTTEYEVGDFVVYNDQLYKCISATSGAWDSSKWQLATLNDLVADIEGAVAFVNDKANVNGNYPTMTVGNADQLNSTVFVVDKVPYLYRTSGGDADIGNREYDKIIGGSLGINQLVKNGNFASDSNWNKANVTASVKNNVATVEVSNTSDPYFEQILSGVANHKYLFLCEAKAISGGWRIAFFYNGSTASSYKPTNSVISSSNFEWYGGIVDNTISANNNRIRLTGSASGDGIAIGNQCQIKNVMLIDLTQMLGSAIADYIYSLEQANAGAGVAWFRNYFKEEDYPYNAGAIKNVKLVSHDMVGFNQWDEELRLGYGINAQGQQSASSSKSVSKNLIPCLPNTQYFMSCQHETAYGGYANVYFYDANQNFLGIDKGHFVYLNNTGNSGLFTTPSNAWFMCFVIASGDQPYNNDICINLSWSGWRNGQYEPYQKNSYPLDTTIELRGIPKLDSDNHLYFDGDEYSSDGKVVRKYGIVDLGSLDWNALASQNNYRMSSAGIIDLVKKPADNNTKANILCSKYVSFTANEVYLENIGIWIDNSGRISVYDTNYNQSTSAAAFKSAMSGVYLVYELATPTEETATPFQEPQIVDDFGTEEYVVPTQDGWQVPVGHDTKYPANLRDKLQRLPDMPSVSQNVTETYVVNYNGTTKKCTFVAIDTWLGSNGYKKASELPTVEALGGTLRQLLAISQSVDFLETGVIDLGDVDYYKVDNTGLFMFSISDKADKVAKMICTKYKYTNGSGFETQNGCIGSTNSDSYLKDCLIKDTSLASLDATQFKAAMKGVLLAYEKESA